MASTIGLSWPDTTYSASAEGTLPSAVTLQSDLTMIENAVNANAASMVETTDTDV